MRKALLVFLVALLGVGGYLYYVNFVQLKEVHYHAGFRAYVDGKLQDFTTLKYMHVEPCTDEAESAIHEDEQEEKAHLHDYVGDVVHVHRSNAVWADLFKNIKFSIDTSKPIEGYINGKKVNNVLNYPIRAYDSFVLLIGKYQDSAIYLKNAVKKDHILKNEKTSEKC